MYEFEIQMLGTEGGFINGGKNVWTGILSSWRSKVWLPSGPEWWCLQHLHWVWNLYISLYDTGTAPNHPIIPPWVEKSVKCRTGREGRVIPISYNHPASSPCLSPFQIETRDGWAAGMAPSGCHCSQGAAGTADTNTQHSLRRSVYDPLKSWWESFLQSELIKSDQRLSSFKVIFRANKSAKWEQGSLVQRAGAQRY